MIHRALEITGSGRCLRKERGFLLVCDKDRELGRLPLDDLEVVLFAGHGVTCTGELLNTLSDRCIPLVLCDRRFMPASVLWPVESHRMQSGRIRAQADLSAPLRKRLWQQLVRAKIEGQNAVLARCAGAPSPRLARLARGVKSGDPDNAEGEAARVYWPLLFGPEFRRNRAEPGINAALNYGYTVLRAAVARAVMLAGLHPAFSLHHHNRLDSMPLVDDLIEPFRPIVDLLVYHLPRGEDGGLALGPAEKERLHGLTGVDMAANGITSPVSECLLALARSLADVCEGRRRTLILPDGFHDLA